MDKRKVLNAALAGALVLGPVGLPACDSEDQRDAEEVGNEFEKNVEDLGEEAEEELDKLDSDGKDD